MPKVTYTEAGVNVATAGDAVAAIKASVRATYNKSVLTDVGSFGGVYGIGHGRALVASTDSVGTKAQVAKRAGRHDTIGKDLAHHCLGDLVVQGPVEPLFFLDYFGTGHLDPNVARDVVVGLCEALGTYGCAVLGGEIAEMSGTYFRDEYDIVGTIVGLVEIAKIIDRSTVVPGDDIIGIGSDGLHTNGYSLARKVIFELLRLRINSVLYTANDGTKVTVADELLRVHRCYYTPMFELMDNDLVKAAAHITGGGIPGNLVRVLPSGTAAYLDRKLWVDHVPPVFDILRKTSDQGWHDYHGTFNDGIGMALVVDPKDTQHILERLHALGERAWRIGWIEPKDLDNPSVWIKRDGTFRRQTK